MPKIVLITGKAGVGKDTLAKELKRQLEDRGKRVLITHYADLVKYVAREFCDWDGKKDENGRTLLQQLGTDLFRNFYKETYWIDFTKSIVDVLGDMWDYVLIPDCRFPNEIDCWGEYDYISTRVNRIPENIMTEEQMNHSSETALDDYIFDHEFYLLNMEDMIEQVSDFVSDKLERKGRFTKDDLRDWDVVVLRNENKYTVSRQSNKILSIMGFMYIDDYDNELKCIPDDESDVEESKFYDIMEVYRGIEQSGTIVFADALIESKCVYKRKESK